MRGETEDLASLCSVPIQREEVLGLFPENARLGEVLYDS